MLVLSRKVGEEIRIGDDIIVKVNRLAGGRVSIGVEAPANVKIIRGELHQLVQQFDDPAEQDRDPMPAEFANAHPLSSRMAR